MHVFKVVVMYYDVQTDILIYQFCFASLSQIVLCTQNPPAVLCVLTEWRNGTANIISISCIINKPKAKLQLVADNGHLQVVVLELKTL